MKKIVSVVLAVVMMTMCLGITGFATEISEEEISFNHDTMYDLIQLLDHNMPSTWQERVDVFNALAVYMETDVNMDALIDMVETLTVPGDNLFKTTFEGIISRLGTDLTDNQLPVLFALDVLHSLPAEKRLAALNEFKTSQNAALDSVDQTALQTVYNEFVNVDGEPGHGHLVSHDVGPNRILLLAKAFQGELLLTDDAENSGDFAIKSVSDSFKTNLGTFVANHFATINGADITDGQVVLDAFVAALNSFEDELKDNIKTVLGADEIALYEPLASVDDDEGDEDDDTPGIGGWGSSSKPSTPNPADKIGKIQPATTPVGEPGAADAAYIYTDTEDHWAKDYIAELSKRGIFKGYDDGGFKPDMGITREEIAVAMTRALDLESRARYAPNYNFADSAFISLWAVDSVNMMVKEGIFEGYDDNEYKPQRIITREELVAVIMRMFNSDLARETLVYVDHEHVGDWAREYLEKAAGLDIVSGYPDGTFRPANPITRGEAAKILYNFMHYAGLN